MNLACRFFFLGLLLTCCVPVSYAASPSDAPRPNILMIAIDDLNDWVGFLGGHPQASRATPNLDRLAASGTVFANAHAQAPLCGPSRTSILTGLLPSTTGIYLHVDDAEIKKASDAAAAAVFLPEFLSSRGYSTIGVGKLFHRGDRAETFQEFGGFDGHGQLPADRFVWDSERTMTDWGPYPERDEETPDYRYARYAMEALQRDHDRPFFLAVGFYRPHIPWYVPQKWFDLFPKEEIVLPPYFSEDRADLPAIAQEITTMPATPSTAWAIENDEWRSIIQAYLACVAFVDNLVGMVLQALEESPYADNTIVVLWSDHGYHLGEKDIFAKFTLWQRSTRVPLVFAGPGIPADVMTDRAVGLVDIYPTLLDLAGLRNGPPLDGRSLVPLMREPNKEWPYPALTYYGQNNVSLVKDYHRYIRYEDGSEELYDRRNDPNEWVNLATQRHLKEKRGQLQKLLPPDPAPMSPLNYLNWNDYWDRILKQ
jgi:arylsulfatase A-like enzyme